MPTVTVTVNRPDTREEQAAHGEALAVWINAMVRRYPDFAADLLASGRERKSAATPIREHDNV